MISYRQRDADTRRRILDTCVVLPPIRSTATGGTGGGATSPLTGSIEMRSKRSGLRIRGRVKNRKDTREEKMTVSGELMPVIDSLFSGFTHYYAWCAITKESRGLYAPGLFLYPKY